jgi:hypothetical protein
MLICQTKYLNQGPLNWNLEPFNWYLEDMLKKFDITYAKPIKTTILTNGHFNLDEDCEA